MNAAIPQTVAIKPEAALAELRWLALAVSQDPTRYTIARVWVDGKRAVATDGHRLHFITYSVLPAGFSISGADLDVVFTLTKSYPLIGLYVDPHETRLEFACGTLTFRKCDAGFPDYERLLPAEVNPVETVTRDLRKTFVGEGEYPDYSVIGPAHFNARYVKEALNGAPKKVNVYGPADDFSPVLFRYANRGAIVMPVRK